MIGLSEFGKKGSGFAITVLHVLNSSSSVVALVTLYILVRLFILNIRHIFNNNVSSR